MKKKLLVISIDAAVLLTLIVFYVSLIANQQFLVLAIASVVLLVNVASYIVARSEYLRRTK